MKFFKKFIIYFYIFFFSFHKCAFAQTWPFTTPQGLFTLNQAVAAAIQSSPTLKESRLKTGVSEAKIISTKTLINPYFTFQTDIDEKTYAFGLTRTFIPPRLYKYQQKIARLNNEIEKLEVQKEEFDISFQARIAYIDYYNAVEILKTYKEIREERKNILEKSQKRIKIGKIKQSDIIFLESNILNMTGNIEQAKHKVIAAKHELERSLNKKLEESTEPQPPEEFPPAIEKEIGKDISENKDIKIEKLTQLALKSRPLMLEARKSIEMAGHEREISLLSRVPILILAAGAILDLDNNDYGAFINGQIELPIFERNQGPIKEAKSKVEYAKEHEKTLGNEIKQEVRASYNDLIAAKETLNEYKTVILPKNDEIRKKAVEYFYRDEFPISQLISIEKTYMDIKITYLDVLKQYQLSVGTLEKYVGVSHKEPIENQQNNAKIEIHPQTPIEPPIP